MAMLPGEADCNQSGVAGRRGCARAFAARQCYRAQRCDGILFHPTAISSIGGVGHHHHLHCGQRLRRDRCLCHFGPPDQARRKDLSRAVRHPARSYIHTEHPDADRQRPRRDPPSRGQPHGHARLNRRHHRGTAHHLAAGYVEIAARPSRRTSRIMLQWHRRALPYFPCFIVRQGRPR